jgi:two-component system chemotaxis response regulator CheY
MGKRILIADDSSMMRRMISDAAKEILRFDPEAQIIFLSNLNDVKYREDALRLGVKGFVNKNEPVKLFRFIDNS